MRARRWLEWVFIKEGFVNLFWNFHYAVILGIITLVLFLGVVTIGPALLALCSSMRLAAEGKAVTVEHYLREVKRLFIPGIVFSGILGFAAGSLYSNLYVLANTASAGYHGVAYLAIALVTVLLFFLIYYPFVALRESRILQIIVKSAFYTAEHFWDTIIHISLLYLLWRILAISPVVAAIVFLPLATYALNRFIVANNQVIDELDEKSARETGHG